MARAAFLILVALVASPLSAREVVEASAPTDVAVTIYRDPDGGSFDKDRPQGFAMISETRTVTLPPGESTIRFVGVAEGMIAVSAIVTGLPGGTIEKNRNSAFLSPKALVDGTLGNRVTITRTNPATGIAASEDAIVRTRADGGIVLETSQGYEAVRCSGLPEKLTFDDVPAGLYAQPVFTIDTRDETGGTYEVTLTYLSWGFDWQAHYVATLKRGVAKGRREMQMLSWLTLVNDNGQSFEHAELLVVAGTLNVYIDYQSLAQPPRGESLRLQCWPIGNTAAGTYPYPPPPPPAQSFADNAIIVTGRRVEKQVGLMETAAPVAVLAGEENLGDLKLFRVPEPITVRAKGLKQVAFLDKERVRGEFVYEADCDAYSSLDNREFHPADLLFETENDEKHGLGQSLPKGGVTVFEPSSAGDLLIGEDDLRDYAVGQDVEIGLGESTKVFAMCAIQGLEPENDSAWRDMRVVLTNSGSESARLRLVIGSAADWEVKDARGLKLKDGERVVETTVRPGQLKELTFRMRSVYAEDD